MDKFYQNLSGTRPKKRLYVSQYWPKTLEKSRILKQIDSEIVFG
jgi:hypothetical protein